MKPSDGRREFAPAKINLFLHVGPVGDDGYHPISSLMVFANVGDELSLTSAKVMEFVLSGPFGGDLAPDADNLVVRAREALLAAVARPEALFRLTLTKSLPIAAGLGGGSADAAAALRLIRRRFDLSLSDERLAGMARSLGADVYPCLLCRPTLASGRGDVLSPAPQLPDLHAVLANPLVPSPTAEVYRAYDLTRATADEVRPSETLSTTVEAVAFLRACRNDLQMPAEGLRPEIAEVLAALTAQPETLLARMSGSGATCFAVCADANATAALSTRISRLRPNWWVRPVVLGGSAAS